MDCHLQKGSEPCWQFYQIQKTEGRLQKTMRIKIQMKSFDDYYEQEADVPAWKTTTMVNYSTAR